eukprot:m.30723 g.30723  ORF g.30723 m.30723 type:complete len:335 (-) comp4808_c0_seq2:2051-3055(-)
MATPPQPFSATTVPALVYLVDGSATIPATEGEAPVRIIFDGTALRFYAAGKLLIALPAGAACVRDGRKFLLPFEQSEGVQKWVAIVFADQTPQAAMDEVAAVIVRVCQLDTVDQWGSRVAGHIERATGHVSRGLSAGAQRVSALISEGSVYLRGRITPTAEPVQVHPTVRSGVATAAAVSRAASEVVGVAVAAAVSGLGQLGTSVLGAVGSGQNSEMGKVLTATARAVVTVVGEVGTAKDALASTVRDEAASLVGHRYGTDARHVASAAIDAVVAVQRMSSAVRLRNIAAGSVGVAASNALGGTPTPTSMPALTAGASGKDGVAPTHRPSPELD